MIQAWQRIMARAHENPNAVACCVSDDTLTQLLPHLQVTDMSSVLLILLF